MSAATPARLANWTAEQLGQRRAALQIRRLRWLSPAGRAELAALEAESTRRAHARRRRCRALLGVNP